MKFNQQKFNCYTGPLMTAACPKQNLSLHLAIRNRLKILHIRRMTVYSHFSAREYLNKEITE